MNLYRRTPYRWLKRGNALVLVLVLLLAFLPPAPAAAAEDLLDTVSVGLYYASSALPSANLQNVTGYGSGYELGYYTGSDQKTFVSLGETLETEITMLPDQTTTFNGMRIGGYHLEQARAYRSYEDAAYEAAQMVDGFVAYADDRFYVRFGSYETYWEASAAADAWSDCIAVGESAYGITVIATQTGEILFELDMGEDTALGVVPMGRGETRTWFKGYRYNGAFRYARVDGENLYVTSILPLEDYVASVLGHEFYASWPDEVLKAGACCIRTFVHATHKHTTFDVCNSVDCQVYRGVLDGDNWERLVELCEQTRGERIYYGDTLIQAVYHSSNGGATESAANTWGSDRPYLQAVYDPYESTVATGAKQWSYVYSLGELTRIAQTWGFQCSQIVDVYVSKYSEVGNVLELTFVDASGRTKTFTGDDTVLFGESILSRRYVVIPPGGSAEVTEVSLGDGKTSRTVSVTGNSVTTDRYVVYDGVTESQQLDALTVMTADGPVELSGEVCILSGQSSGNSSQTQERGEYDAVELTTRTVRNTSGGYMVYGSGWGHNVGLSAYGAYAMAKLGYTYTEILQFYYTGVTVR